MDVSDQRREYCGVRVVDGCWAGLVGPSAYCVLVVLFVARRIGAAFVADVVGLEWRLAVGSVGVDPGIGVEERGAGLALGALVESR